MKKLLLLSFLFISITAFGQKNEINVSYQAIQKDDLGEGVSISYFRNISTKSAIGIKANYNKLGEEDYYGNFHSGSIDLVNRWNFSKDKLVRFMAELGISALRTYEESSNYFLFCGTFAPGERMPHFGEDWQKSTYYGFASGLGIDVQLCKFLIIGTNYNFSIYRTNQETYNFPTLQRSNISFNLGVKF